MSAQRVLVTGASGFLGQEIVRQFGDGYSLVATGRRREAGLDSKVHYISVDLLADDLGGCLPDNTDTILHTAAVIGGSARSLEQNLGMSRRLIDWGSKIGVRNLVLISSAAVYAPSGEARRETFLCRPQSAYGRSKLAAEQCAIAANAGMRLVILRKPALIGPTRSGNIVRLIQALGRNRFVLVGDGGNQKSLISVVDAARACLATVDYLNHQRSGDANRIFNVSGGFMSMMNIVDMICQELGRGRPPTVPAGLATRPLKVLSAVTMGMRPFGRVQEAVEQFLRSDVLDASLFREEVGFEPVTDIGRALKEMVRYQNPGHDT